MHGANVTKGYVISDDDEFSADGNTVYTVNAVNVVKATNQATLSGTAPQPDPRLPARSPTRSTRRPRWRPLQPAGLTYNTATKQFTVTYNGLSVTYTVGAASVTDNRNPANTFPATISGSQLTFTDTVSGVTFTFDDSGNNPITADFAYTNHFFVDVITGVTYYIDVPRQPRRSALLPARRPRSTPSSPANGNTYLIHYNDVERRLPGDRRARNVNVGVATVGSDTFTVHVDQVDPTGGGAGINVNTQLLRDQRQPLHDHRHARRARTTRACSVVGDAIAAEDRSSRPIPSSSPIPSITYTLQLDANNQPASVAATFPVKPSRDLISVTDDVYIITYNTVSTGSLLGQGQASIADHQLRLHADQPLRHHQGASSSSTTSNIYDAGSVVGQFTVYLGADVLHRHRHLHARSR